MRGVPFTYCCAVRLVVSKRSEIALAALQVLSRHRGQTVPGAVLSRETGAGQAQLSQVMGPLIAEGWVTSRTGPDGGYALSPRLRKLSVLQVVESIEGPLATGECLIAGRTCGGSDPCAFHATWEKARTSLSTSLAAASAI